jgi:hypothetical protein
MRFSGQKWLRNRMNIAYSLSELSKNHRFIAVHQHTVFQVVAQSGGIQRAPLAAPR